jgi:hypothetical protein
MKTLQYIDFSELQRLILAQLGIDDQNVFYRFDEYTGDSGAMYQNLWHVWMWLVDDVVYNRCIVPTSIGGYDLDDRESYFYKTFVEQFGTYPIPFLQAINEVMWELGWKDSDEEGPIIYIKYDW